MSVTFLPAFQDASRRCYLAGTDAEGDAREGWHATLADAVSLAAACIGPGEGPPWQAAEIWANAPEEWQPVVLITA